MAVIVLDSNEYVYFDSSYKRFLVSEDSGGDLLLYDRKNLYDSSAFYFDSSYKRFLVSEDSGGDLLLYDRKNLYDSSAFYIYNVQEYYIGFTGEENIIKVAYGEPAIKERWG